jgi:hypothetical protein
MNDRERTLWVQNDEGLYRWWRSERKPLAKFIKDNREQLDAIINKAINQEPRN